MTGADEALARNRCSVKTSGGGCVNRDGGGEGVCTVSRFGALQERERERERERESSIF